MKPRPDQSSSSSPPDLTEFWKDRRKPKLFINAISRHAGALKLTGDDFMLFMYLLDRQGSNTSSWPSKARIADDLGWPFSSRRCKRLDAAIKRLTALGYVEVRTTSTGRGALKRTRNHYDVSPLIRGLGYQPRHEKLQAQQREAEVAGAALPVMLDGETLMAMMTCPKLPEAAHQFASALGKADYQWSNGAESQAAISRERIINTGEITAKQLARLFTAVQVVQ